MKSIKQLNSFILAFLFVFGLSGLPCSVLATDTPTEVSVTFIGDEANKAGFMQSVITVIPGDGAALTGYYLIYYTDGNETLKGYDELASIPVKDGSSVSCEIKDGVMIPFAAKGIAVFESNTRFLDNVPSVADAVATVRFPGNKLLSIGKPEISFGAVSDVHMNYEQYSRGAYRKWANALDFFSGKGIEYVTVAGDMTGDRGETPDLEEQYEKYVSIINESDIDLDNVFECIGNHGNTTADIGLMSRYLAGANDVRPYADSPYYYTLIKGETRDNLFVFMRQEIDATGESSTKDNFSQAQMDWLEGLLDKYCVTKTNVFLYIHSPFLNFGAGDRKNGGYTACITFKEEYTQTMRLRGLLQKYKDIVVMSGHTHVSLYDNVNYSDEYNSFARTVHIGSTSQPCGYGDTGVYTRSTDGRYEVTPTYGSEGYTVDVYTDYIVYTGYNFSTGKIIPGACLLIPVNAYGGAPNPNMPKDPSEVFKGSGTVKDPYIIASADDFMALTAGFNACSNTVESEMYGYGKFFLQTNDIDMSDYYGYCGTEANGNAKAFFAGTYNGGGHTLTVNINGTNQRSVFPYVYGTVCNLKIKGRITSEVSAQPIRTLYGNIINCIFELDLYSSSLVSGVIYSNYGLVYNVYTFGVLGATSENNPVASNDTSVNYVNVFHNRTNASGTALSDTYGTRSNDLNAIANAFNDKSNASYSTALGKLGGLEIIKVSVSNSSLIFGDAPAEKPPVDNEGTLGDVNGDGAIDQFDYILVKRHYFETRLLTDDEMKTADVNGDEKIDQFDYILIKRIYFGTYKIV